MTVPATGNSAVDALSSVLSQSATLTSLMQTYQGNANNLYSFPATGTAIYGTPNASGGWTIIIPQNLVPNSSNLSAVTRFGTLLGHELGHAVDAGGFQNIMTAPNPDAAAVMGDNSEGVALVSEYKVASDFNAAGYPTTMYSGAGVQGALDSVKAKDQGTTNFDADAVSTAASYAGTMLHPSTAPNLFYSQYYADSYVLGESGLTQIASINMLTLPMNAITYTETTGGGWNFNANLQVGAGVLGTTPATLTASGNYSGTSNNTYSGLTSLNVKSNDGTINSTTSAIFGGGGVAPQLTLSGVGNYFTDKIIYSPAAVTQPEWTQQGLSASASGGGGELDLSKANVTLAAGSTETVSGSGNSMNLAAANVTLFVASGNGNVLAAANSSDTLTLGGNTSTTINGNGASATAANGASGVVIGFSGAGETANLNNGSIYLNSNGSSATVNGSGDTANAFFGATGLAVGFSGSNNTANLSNDGLYLNSNGSSLTVNGSGNNINSSFGATQFSVGVSGSNNTVNLSNDPIYLNSNGSSATINGSGDTVAASFNATGLAVGFNGTGDVANLSGDSIYLNTNGSSVTANGAYDTVYNSFGASGLTVNFSGANETAYLSNDTLNLNNASTSLNAYGFQDTVNASNGGSVIFSSNGTLNGNGATTSFANQSSDTVSGKGDIVYAGSGSLVGVSGQGSDYISATGNSTINILSGTKDSFLDANGESDVINLSNSVGVAINGAYGEYVNGANSDTVNIGTSVSTTNLGVSVNDSNGTLNISGAGVDLAGGNDNINVTGGTFALLSGQSDFIYGAGNGFSGGGGGVSLMSGTQAYIEGTSFHVGLDGNNGNVSIGLNSPGSTGSTDVIGITGKVTGESITGNNIVIDAGSNETIVIRGSNDVVHGGTGDIISATGTNDSVYATGSTINFSGTNTGDFVNGNSDTGSDWGGGTPYNTEPDGNYTGYGAYDGYAFSSQPGAKGTDIGVLASYDASLHDQSDAVAAQTARLQAVTASGSTVMPSSFTSQFEGPKWASSTITWSLATSAGSVGTPYSGFLGSQYDTAVEQAFQVWAAASGLKFQEVADSATSDIRVGWSTLGTKTSSVLGYTNLHGLNGQIQAGVDISLENPNDVTLVKDANGQLAYSGTQAELSQLLIHEIGHALGLADNSDPNSVMNAVLTSTNRTLDATDLAGIKALYSGASGVALIGGAQPQTTGGAGSSANPVTVPMTSVLGSFSAQAEALISAMASFSPTTSSSPFVVPPTLGSTLTSAAAINLAQPGH